MLLVKGKGYNMKLNSIKNGEHFIYNGIEYEKLFGGFVSSAKNLITNESETFFGKTNVERPPKNKNKNLIS